MLLGRPDDDGGEVGEPAPPGLRKAVAVKGAVVTETGRLWPPTYVETKGGACVLEGGELGERQTSVVVEGTYDESAAVNALGWRKGSLGKIWWVTNKTKKKMSGADGMESVLGLTLELRALSLLQMDNIRLKRADTNTGSAIRSAGWMYIREAYLNL